MVGHPHQSRKSLTEAFPDINIARPHSPAQKSTASSPTKKTSSTAISKMQDLSTTIGKTFASGWPSWRSIRGCHNAPAHFTIRLAEHLREEAAGMVLPEDPATIIAQARQESQRGGVASFEKAWEEMEKSLITLVYGSNLIETAGTNFRLTLKICRDIFRGKEVDPNISERDPEYQEYVDNLIKTQRKGDIPNVIRSRREVINHAKALNFLIDRIVLDNMALSEELLLQAHRILQDNINDDDVAPGQYREHEVAVSYTKPGQKRQRSICIRAKAVPGYMKDMIEHLDNDIAAAEKSEDLDPYTLAARYHHQFVMIHPFGDGNGRMSRMILNVLLLKYAGHLSVIGSDCDKDEYLDIVCRGQKIFSREDMEVDFEKQTSHLEFARHVLRKSKAGLEDMWSWATQRKGGKGISQGSD
ncbi:uncharacterized protein DNG_05260 [Cephalotrichum gorgonifer]|uniref:Fido domain-containing protein n=1 Tax=Cephalotrichum gorgonifer TaxID=2041049 RepID=A0AAE8MY04_9PEZI|nr:uncharacterized protein DNG_05260 [Cephalotrichum gorgonifer]